MEEISIDFVSIDTKLQEIQENIEFIENSTKSNKKLLDFKD